MYVLNRFLRQFRTCDDGAVTVDWVILTAGIVGLGVAALMPIGSAAVAESEGLGACQDQMAQALANDREDYVSRLELASEGCSSQM